MAGDEAVLRVLLEGTGGVSPESPAGARPTQPAREQQPRQTRPEPAGRPAFRPESPFNQLIHVLGKFRGTIGGILGPLAGVALDVAKAFAEMQESGRAAASGLREVERAGKGQAQRIAEQFVPPPPLEPMQTAIPVVRRSATPAIPLSPENEYRRRVLGGASHLNPQQQAELDELEKRHQALQQPSQPAVPPPLAQPPSGIGKRPMMPEARRQIPEAMKVGVGEEAIAGVGQTMAGGLAAAAGPAVAIMAVIEAAKMLKAGMQQAVAAVGDFAKGMSSPEVSAAGFVEGIGTASKKASDALLYVSPELGILAGVAGQAAESVSGLMKNMDALAARFIGFGPGIAQAQAMATVEHIAGEFRRGRELGDSLSRYVIARTELQEKWEDVKARFIKEITPTIIAGMKMLEQLLPVAEAAGGEIAGLAKLLLLILQPVEGLAKFFIHNDLKQPVKITDMSKRFLDEIAGAKFAKGQGA